MLVALYLYQMRNTAILPLKTEIQRIQKQMQCTSTTIALSNYLSMIDNAEEN